MITKKVIFSTLILILILSSFISCTTSNDEDSEGKESGSDPIKITLLNSKGEIQKALEEGAKLYSEKNKNVTLEINPAPAGQSPFEKITALYAAGSAPALQLLDGGDVVKLKDKYLDLSNEKWINDLLENSVDNFVFDGKTVAFPMTVEGYGMIYNKKVVGDDFDVSKLSTVDDLEKTLKELGDKSLVIPSMDWSLGAHFFAIVYSAQGKDYESSDKFFDDLKAGKVDLTKDDAFNGLMDSFDVMKKYNVAKKDPLPVTYEKGPEMIGKEEIGLWFMGNWSWPQIESFSEGNTDYGFAPVPISNNKDDYGNSQIVAGVTKYVSLDKEQNSKDQQDEAKKFLDWLVYDEEGQDLIVNKCNIVPAFTNIELEPIDPLGKSLKQYIDNENTLLFMNLLPPDHWKNVGASMQKYLAGKINRKELAKEVEEYWKNVKE
ncbi:MAG: ABC transporter substrate-binding protein [Clostridiales bacterium]